MKYHRRLDQLHTLFRLSMVNILRVAIYRLKMKFRYYQFRLPIKAWRLQMRDCFSSASSVELASSSSAEQFVENVNRIMAGEWCFYFYHWFKSDALPSWTWCPFAQKQWSATQAHWSRLSFFAKPGEDIKNIWELSRFYWAPQLALAYRLTGQSEYQIRLNQLIEHWCVVNTPQKGYQWLCAQETAIRLINFLLADHLIHVDKTPPSLVAVEFVETHVRRILLTMSYAIAQDNNHATSEAAALYIAGAWLSSHNPSSLLGRRALLKGTYWLENRVQRLIAQDGTFSQYSVTYHRLLVDTLSLCVWARCRQELPEFSVIFYQRYRAAFEWLRNLVDPVSGDAPNLGANDGALLFKLDGGDYRNFRPSLQLASVLLDQKKLYQAGPWDLPLTALGIAYESLPIAVSIIASVAFADGGFVKLQHANHWALLRYPQFRFRPGHADAFHVDLWMDGRNVLQDVGSYSYNPVGSSGLEFKGVAAHNTIQFDDHEQMPVLSRFLWGAWLKSNVLHPLKDSKELMSWCGKYQDYQGAQHQREIRQTANGYCIKDCVSGYQQQAVLRWHVCSGDWLPEEDGWRLGKVKLLIYVGGKIALPVLRESWHSLYYQQKQLRPVFEVSLPASEAVVKTLIELE